MKIKTILAVFVFISLADMAFSINVKFTNLQCEEFDKPFATFAQCRLKAINRYKVALNLHVVLHQVPVNNISLNAQLLQKGNGYRPFMYNDTMDFCKFLKNPSRFMFWKIVWTNAIRPFSNINHTCPYDHDIIVDNVVLKSEMFQLIPFPPNEYMVRLKVGAYNHYKAEVRIFFQISN
ncbi:uncharacterized protein LOC142227113 [Haematobia irritans]|uniref:uncharacterized protein LOC142227113 n=1 Tax=Haematobia irritans TaxID=7368 RepID=UPI003F500324